jgi:hypothetical protein
MFFTKIRQMLRTFKIKEKKEEGWTLYTNPITSLKEQRFNIKKIFSEPNLTG